MTPPPTPPRSNKNTKVVEINEEDKFAALISNYGPHGLPPTINLALQTLFLALDAEYRGLTAGVTADKQHRMNMMTKMKKVKKEQRDETEMELGLQIKKVKEKKERILALWDLKEWVAERLLVGLGGEGEKKDGGCDGDDQGEGDDIGSGVEEGSEDGSEDDDDVL